MDFYKQRVPIIEDERDLSAAFLGDPGIIRGPNPATGMVPRDYAKYPETMFAPPTAMSLIDPSDYDAYFDEQEATESSLEHLFLRDGKPAFTNLDQNGAGYCWSYSTAHAAMFVQLAAHKPVPRFNPHAVAAIIKGGADEGGWCGLSADFVRKNGQAVEGTGPGQWPLHSRNLKYDTPALRAAMAPYKIEENWYDTARSVWDQKLNDRQLTTCGFINAPCAADWNFMSHSVALIRRVRLEANSWGSLIVNSWKGWGYYGLGVIRGRYSLPDNAVGLVTLVA